MEWYYVTAIIVLIFTALDSIPYKKMVDKKTKEIRKFTILEWWLMKIDRKIW